MDRHHAGCSPRLGIRRLGAKAGSARRQPSFDLMKLIGYTVRRRSAGIFDVHVPLNDLTVLLGANDAGKSTILRALHEDLGGGPERRDWGDDDGGAIFVE